MVSASSVCLNLNTILYIIPCPYDILTFINMSVEIFIATCFYLCNCFPCWSLCFLQVSVDISFLCRFSNVFFYFGRDNGDNGYLMLFCFVFFFVVHDASFCPTLRAIVPTRYNGHLHLHLMLQVTPYRHIPYNMVL